MNVTFYLIISTVSAYIGAAMIWHSLRKERRYNAIAYGQNTDLIANYKSKLEVQKDRILELEDGIKGSFGVSVRKEVTEMSCAFDKVEMTFLMAGMYKLINSKEGTVADKEFYIKLYKKIQENTDKLEEGK